MSGATKMAISKSRMTLLVSREPVMSGTGKKVVMMPSSTEGNKNINMNLNAGALIK